MLHDLLLALWFFLPPAFSNAVPIPVAAIPWLKRFEAPMDFGKTFRGKRVLGPHKTWRGMISGIIVATLTLWIQQELYRHYGWAHRLCLPVQYDKLPLFLLGPLFAIGALGGDAVKSFFKRQRGTPSGGSWVPFDQIDYVLGGILVSLPFVILPWSVYAWMIVLYIGAHLLVSYLGWLVGLKEHPI